MDLISELDPQREGSTAYEELPSPQNPILSVNKSENST